MGLSDEQRQKIKDYAISEAVSQVARPILHKIGDLMAKSKRPFWRGLVGLFRGK